MAVQHKIYPVYGVQFHPESVMSEHGEDIIKNFLKKARIEI
jgi:anthranilate/para-aminobenzoate synthase component II